MFSPSKDKGAYWLDVVLVNWSLLPNSTTKIKLAMHQTTYHAKIFNLGHLSDVFFKNPPSKVTAI